MIEYIKVKSPLSSSITQLVFKDENPANGYLVTSMSGIGPGEGDIKSEDLALSDGALYTGSKIKVRDMSMSILFIENENYSIEDLRKRIVRIFPVKRQISMLVKNEGQNGRIAHVNAYVKKVDVQYFSAASGATISLVSFDPYYEKYKINSGTPETWSPNSMQTNSYFVNLSSYKYYRNQNDIFSNDSEINNGYTIIMKLTNTNPLSEAWYNTGKILINYNISDDTTQTVYNLQKKNEMIININKLARNGNFPVGKYLVIVSERGKKSIYIKTSIDSDTSTDYNALSALDYINSDWLEADILNATHGLSIYMVTESQNANQTIYTKADITNIIPYNANDLPKTRLLPRYYGV